MKKENIFTFIFRIISGSGHKEKCPEITPGKRVNIWGASGRKAQMDSGSVMQLKPFTSPSKFSK